MLPRDPGARVTLLLFFCTLAMAGDMIAPLVAAGAVAAAPYVMKGLSSLFGGGGDSGAAERAKLAAMRQAADQYAQARPAYMQARMNALGNLAGLFRPVNTALGQMYGPGAQFDMSQLTNAPITGTYVPPQAQAEQTGMPVSSRPTGYDPSSDPRSANMQNTTKAEWDAIFRPKQSQPVGNSSISSRR